MYMKRVYQRASKASTAQDRALEAFRLRFRREPEILVRAPGRVNLIGEHVDYNGGIVLPVAIDRAAWVAASLSRDAWTTLEGVDSQFDDLQKIATNGHIHDELLTLLREIAL